MTKKHIGYLLFSLACCMWVLPMFIGFIDLPTSQKALFLTVIVVLGEVFFVLSILFLGKEFVQTIKRHLAVRWRWFSRKYHKNH